ncbi:uncharacterized protein LOC132269052 isoform X1 [Cornus florida]|uniref:uncharacterized protein LOC132269052 isoform X1 n=1 Tax=Cornus florida TaxID=4283 RepID=UPI002899C9FB|nr:uncharacterized protein LOC132269052 isoform X1 [Cornus florida]
MDQTSGSSTGKKRAREEDIVTKSEDIDQTPSLEENFTFSDTLVALRIMRAQFPRIDKVSVQPFILQSQLYSSVKDRTQVDRELESLRRERVLRIFKLNTGQDDHAIMFLDDYLVQIDRIVKRMEAKKQVDLAVFEWFRTHVIHSKLDPSIGHQELLSLLSTGGKVKDEHVSLLINAGLLTRQLIDPNMYWFAIPNIGSVLKGLSQKGTPFLSKPKEIQRDDVGCFREEASPIFSVGYEISHSRSGWFRSPRNCPDTQWLSYPGLKGLKTQEIHKLQPIAI